MPENDFPILGTEIPAMYGRSKVINRLEASITKRSPSHLIVLGPRYSGKSVILKELENRMSIESSPYQVVINWDLGHLTPSSDESFLETLSQILSTNIKKEFSDYSEYLNTSQDKFEALKEVFDLFEEEDSKILMIWDGFDKPASSGLLTRNLWDQLREIASRSSLRLIISTRRPLNDLLRSEESATSEFWGIFDPSWIRTGCFTVEDLDQIYNQISNININDSAKKEIFNWTGGYPPLFLTLVNKIKTISDKNISNEIVNHVALSSFDEVNFILSQLWKDCSESTKDIFRHLHSHRSLATSEIGNAENELLNSMGFTYLSGNQTRPGCTFLQKYIEGLGEDAGSVIRLFRDSEDYQNNIRSILEHRLNQISRIDNSLFRFLSRAIEDIPESPAVCMAGIRGIIDRSLDLIWNDIFGSKREVPEGWFTYWEQRNEKGIEHWRRSFPRKRGHQIRLLQLVTGTDLCMPKTEKLTKNTYVLANSLQGFGDYGQHIDGTVPSVGTAVSAVITAIELAERIGIELKATSFG